MDELYYEAYERDGWFHWKIYKKAQDDSWEEGYTDAQNGRPRIAPADTAWPSQWLIGFDAAVEDSERKRRERQGEENQQ